MVVFLSRCKILHWSIITFKWFDFQTYVILWLFPDEHISGGIFPLLVKHSKRICRRRQSPFYDSAANQLQDDGLDNLGRSCRTLRERDNVGKIRPPVAHIR